MSKFKYTKEDVLKEMAEALGETEPNKTTKPNVMKEFLAKARLGKNNARTR